MSYNNDFITGSATALNLSREFILASVHWQIVPGYYSSWKKRVFIHVVGYAKPMKWMVIR